MPLRQRKTQVKPEVAKNESKTNASSGASLKIKDSSKPLKTPKPEGCDHGTNDKFKFVIFSRLPTRRTVIIGLIALAMVAFNIMAILQNDVDVSTVAATIAFILAPIVIRRSYRIADSKNLRVKTRSLELHKNDLKSQKKQLIKKEKELKEVVKELQQKKDALDKLAAKQKTNVNNIVALVEESQRISAEQRDINEANSLLDLVQIVMKCAYDDFQIKGQELDNLCFRLSCIPDVEEFYEDRFRKIIQKTNGTVTDVINVIVNLLDPTVPHAEEIFVIKQWKLPKKKGRTKDL